MLLFLWLVLIISNEVLGWKFRSDYGLETNSIDDQNQKDVKLNLIFPGTKWCGSGSIASEYNDLGTLENTDACCRDHDSCSDILEGGQSNHGLTNEAPYTRLNCECDEKFFNCLKDSSDKHSSSVMMGTFYFDVLQTKCYRLDYPVKDCEQYKHFPKRCLKYSYNKNADKKWQWFDVPVFN